MSWIFIADDGEQVHFDVPPRVVELEQQLTALSLEYVSATGQAQEALEQLATLTKESAHYKYKFEGID